jgi:hypothetical protein
MTDIDESTSGTSTPPAPVIAPKPSARSKWQDEDKEESEEVRLSLCYLLAIGQRCSETYKEIPG